ncbi:HD domain-containing protein [Oceanithermus sp.]
MALFIHDDPVIAAFGGLVAKEFEREASGHDWWHVWRVWRLARKLAREEGADLRIVELAALGHDVEDHKLGRQPGTLAAWLRKAGAEAETVARVVDVCRRVSFRGAGVADEMPTLEGQIVQDADRLDAIGAIGIARTFAYGGSRERKLFDSAEKAQLHQSFEAYRSSRSSSLMHFYEKLFLLADRMHTPAARRLARERHAFMEAFVARFLAEWEGKA